MRPMLKCQQLQAAAGDAVGSKQHGEDSVIQRILRHSTVATTQNHYIKTASPDAIAAMKQFFEALLCSRWRRQG
jgi:integrase